MGVGYVICNIDVVFLNDVFVVLPIVLLMLWCCLFRYLILLPVKSVASDVPADS